MPKETHRPVCVFVPLAWKGHAWHRDIGHEPLVFRIELDFSCGNAWDCDCVDHDFVEQHV